MNNNLLVHIGFEKTSSTFFQLNVFPQLSRMLKLNYIDFHSNFGEDTDKLVVHLYKTQMGWDCQPLIFSDNSFISFEYLCSSDPYYWEEHAEQNLKAFGEDAHILIAIRAPRNYLTSIYQNSCYHKAKIQEPQYYFLEDKRYSERLPGAKFAVDKFKYSNIINFYKTRFNRVSVIKFEHMHDLLFLKELFKLTDGQYEDLKSSSKKKIRNRAFSQRSMKMARGFNSFLEKFFLSVGPCPNNVSILRTLEDNKFDSYCDPSFFGRVLTQLKLEFTWFYFLQRRLDRILPYKKFALDFSRLPYIDIDGLEHEYKELPDFTTYNKSKLVKNDT